MKLLKTGPIIRCTHGKSNATIHSSCVFPLFEKCVQEPLNSVKLLPWVGREKAVRQRVSPGFHSMSLICHDSTAQHRHNLQKCLLFFFVVHYKLLLQILFFVVMLRKKKSCSLRECFAKDPCLCLVPLTI